MQKSRKRSQRRTTLLGAAIGSMIIFTFVLTLIAPDLGSRNRSNADLDPFATPLPTSLVIPTPDPDPQLTGRPPYVHSSGLFQTFLPAGDDWIVDEGESVQASAMARVVISSSRRLVVIHNYIQPGVEYESLDSLSANFLTAQHFAGAWQDYGSWEETARTVGDESVVVDFALAAEGHDYLGRTITRLWQDWLFVARIVVPANNPALLDLLQTLVVPTFQGFPALLALPSDWRAYVDQSAGFVLRHPPGWTVAAGSPGRPATLRLSGADNNERVRLWTKPETPITSAEAAETWVRAATTVGAVLSVATVQREEGVGYLVAYRTLDAAGDTHSALAALLNDEAGTLFVADLQIEPPDVNLLDTPSVPGTYADARQSIAEGFIVLPVSNRSAAP
ncbi:MAG: hypothetical protein OZ934_06105 [Anaerolineae bacterium]|nr:hypothetical protein [Anaerolineae bacterium]